MSTSPAISFDDYETITQQLGRAPRGVLAVSYRCPDGTPGVITTAPRLDDGTPFPTLFYLTDKRLVSAASTLEASHVMKWMTARLKDDPELARDYEQAHEAYLRMRNGIHDLGTTFSGGGMPERVKCLHVLIAYALAEGPDRVRLGTEAVALAADLYGLRGTAVPESWPTCDELGIDVKEIETQCV